MTPGRRTPPTGQRLALCLGLALGLHAALFLPSGAAARHVAVARALQVRMLAPLSAPVPPALSEIAPESAAMPPEPKTAATPDPSPAAVDEGADLHADAQAPSLSNPDAPLPNGQGQARVWLGVESDGYVRELRVEPDVLPRAFERVIEQAFEGSRVSAEPRALRSGSLCVEVKFKEGEPPSWQPVQPAGACVA